MPQANALVLCLGDLGRSPRICNQAVELDRHKAKLGLVSVHLAGYATQTPLPVGVVNSSIMVRDVASGQQHADPLQRNLARVLSVVKLLLLATAPFNLIVVQNPPTVPVLWLLLLYRAVLRCLNIRCAVIVDCHNYGYTISAGAQLYHWLALAALEQLEMRLLAHVDAIITVSKAMKADLVKRLPSLSEHIEVCYDQPVQVLSLDQKACRAVLQAYLPADVKLADFKHVCVTSTSYTHDEAVHWVVEACSDVATKENKVLLVITGKGPMMGEVKQLAEKRQTPNFRCVQLFVKHEDYLSVIGAGTVGVCLHTSSSGLDLPMKVVDMVAAHLPCLAYHYLTIEEVLPESACFTDQAGLAKKLGDWENWPATLPVHSTWATEWETKVQRLFGDALA